MERKMDKKLWYLLFVIIMVFSSNVCWAQNKRPWKVTDSFRLKSISDLRVSPDGDQLLFVVSTQSLKNNAKYSQIWLWTKDKGKAVRLTGKDSSVSSPRWSPDGTKIAFFKSNDNGLALWTTNPDESGKKKLTNLEGGESLIWSPDGKKLAYTAKGPQHYKNKTKPPFLPTGNDVMIIDRMLFKNKAYYYSDLRDTYVWTIPAKGGKPTKVSSGDGCYFDYKYYSISWSPDGKYIACLSNQRELDFNVQRDIILLPANGHSDKMIQLTHTSGEIVNVKWGPNGTKLAYKGRIRANQSRDSRSELPKIYTISTVNDTSLDKQTRVNLTESLDRWANQFQWGLGGDKVYFTVQNEGRVELYSEPSGGGGGNLYCW